ncbi:unnamed protein product [Cuscuta epithymum]|uniref:Uncharacterized protein n=1 Tax=Cuscuta epithymum TaxID=186058 RepID=A0AAV0FSE1_9ASTE|nr:unnamed protein product [Cuscuta epithymum]
MLPDAYEVDPSVLSSSEFRRESLGDLQISQIFLECLQIHPECLSSANCRTLTSSIQLQLQRNSIQHLIITTWAKIETCNVLNLGKTIKIRLQHASNACLITDLSSLLKKRYSKSIKTIES